MHRKSSQLLKKGKKHPDSHVRTMALKRMSIKHLFKKLTRKLSGESEFPEKAVGDLMRRLQNTHEEELSCDEVFALVDEYAEATQRGEDVASLKPLIRRHLDMCRECDEEYQALLQVLEGNSSN